MIDSGCQASRGIQTATFYNRTKLHTLHRSVKTLADLAYVKERSNAATIRPAHKSQQKNKGKLPLMPNRREGKRKYNASKKLVSNLERLTNCKISDITDFRLGKRPSRAESGLSEESKKIKLDLNKNIECKETNPNEVFTKEGSRNSLSFTGDKQGRNNSRECYSEKENSLLKFSLDKKCLGTVKRKSNENGNENALSNSYLAEKNDVCSNSFSNIEGLGFVERKSISNLDSDFALNGRLLSFPDNDKTFKSTAVEQQANSNFYGPSNANDTCSNTSQSEALTTIKESENNGFCFCRDCEICLKEIPPPIETSKSGIFGSSKLRSEQKIKNVEICEKNDGKSNSSENALERNFKLNQESESGIFGGLTIPSCQTTRSKPSCDCRTTKEQEDSIFASPLKFNSSLNSSKGSRQSISNLEDSQRTKVKVICTYETERPCITKEAENPAKLTVATDQKPKRTPRKKLSSLDAFVFVGSTQTSKPNKILKDSRFEEPFRILEEATPPQKDASCSKTGSSALLLSKSIKPNGSSKRTSISPESQSSITKYFAPLRKSTSVLSPKNKSVSPTVDKSGKRLRNASSPSNSPFSRKKEQMFLDLGQKNFGHTTCPTCGMVYTSTQPEDETYHVKFHQKVMLALRFNGWKTERVVEHFDDGRVIVVLPQDHPAHLRKVDDVRAVVDEELGFSSELSLRMQDSKTYLFITDKKVVGCVVAVAIQEAFPLLASTTNVEKTESSEQGPWCCSSAPTRAQCGISRVWVLQQYRRKKIASRILECVRYNFMFGGVVSKEFMAFSDPTPFGKKLAESYFGTQNFLVFR